MGWYIVYGLFAFVALINLVLMRRPKAPGGDAKIAILIPARNEASNLAELLPQLISDASGPKVFVFDDESDDGTGAVAQSLGAQVVRPREPLPQGWTGKNRACHSLAETALEATDAEWLLFLDADVRVSKDFMATIKGLASTTRVPVVTAFPQIVPGRGVEPLFLAWVGWILLASNPFGVVSRSGLGHNRFLNGQIQLWKTSVYSELWPNHAVKDKIMEDVQMGRLLARKNVRVDVVNLSSVIRVKMYDTWQQTLDGMSKNSYEITGSVGGSILISLGMFVLALGWILAPSPMLALGLFTLSGVAAALTARAAPWPCLVMPVVTLIGGITILRSTYWKLTGKVTWKGRTYP